MGSGDDFGMLFSVALHASILIILVVYHFHGRPQAQFTGERPAASVLDRIDERVLEVQGESRMGRQGEDPALVRDSTEILGVS